MAADSEESKKPSSDRADAAAPGGESSKDSSSEDGAGVDSAEDPERGSSPSGDTEDLASGSGAPSTEESDDPANPDETSNTTTEESTPGGIPPLDEPSDGTTRCTSAISQRIDLPADIVDAGGHMLMTGYLRDTNSAIVVWTGSRELEPGTKDIPIDLTGVDYCFTSLYDSDGQVVDGQVHIKNCGEAAPVRGGAELQVPEDYETIQEAIDAAEPGDSVFVAAGTYNAQLRLRPNVSLVGAGPDKTTLEPAGSAEELHLVDLTGAHGSSVRGFRLQGVPEGGSCGNDEVFECSGPRHNSAMVSDGHAMRDPLLMSTSFVGGNVFADNDIGLMLYFGNHGVVADNVFLSNQHAIVGNSGGNQIVQIDQNLFDDNGTEIATDASLLFAQKNVFLDGFHCVVNAIQRGEFWCNAADQSLCADLVNFGAGNALHDTSPPFAEALEAGCLGEPPPNNPSFLDFLIPGGLAATTYESTALPEQAPGSSSD